MCAAGQHRSVTPDSSTTVPPRSRALARCQVGETILSPTQTQGDQPAERMADNHEMLGTVGQRSQRKVGVVLQPGARVVAREVNRQRLVPTRSRNACAVSA